MRIEQVLSTFFGTIPSPPSQQLWARPVGHYSLTAPPRMMRGHGSQPAHESARAGGAEKLAATMPRRFGPLRDATGFCRGSLSDAGGGLIGAARRLLLTGGEPLGVELLIGLGVG
jgi:hypothetical protein